MDARGNLYGTAATGGSFVCNGVGCGTVFELTRSNGSAYVLRTLHKFGANQDGDPEGGLIVGSDGSLYGTTYFGPPNEHGVTGTAFKLTPTGSGYQESILYTFEGGADGNAPFGSLVADPSGALYGVTIYGGSVECDCGTVYKLTPSPSGYTHTVIYRFRGNAAGDGHTPSSPLIIDDRGDLYGVTTVGGSRTACSYNGCGIAFELVPSRAGYSEKILHAFEGHGDGAYPSGALTLASGKLYGATLIGGAACSDSNGCGTIFSLSPTASGRTERVLYAFRGTANGQNDGISPNGGLVVGSTGQIFGTTELDGMHECLHRLLSCGTIFALTPGGSGYSESTLYVFKNSVNGDVPEPGWALGSDGTFYGTTAGGGDLQCYDSLPGCGTVYTVAFPR